MDGSLEQLQARHRKEQRDLQGRITNKKKNATKKTRKGVNDECAELERQLRDRHEEELRMLNGDGEAGHNGTDDLNESEGEPTVVAGVLDKGVDDAATKLEQSTIADLRQAGDVSQAPLAQQPKKRNRQKERLARRAAEQEEAAVAAEAEAANMTDHRGIEKTYMLGEFQKHSLVEQEIAPDGHCLFSALADQLKAQSIPLEGGVDAEKSTNGTKSPALPFKTVRRTAAAYMDSHRDDFEPFMEEPFADYVHKIRDTAEWGGQLELMALASSYRVEIRVVQDGRTEVIRPTEATGDEALKVIWLAYYRHGYGLGEHYNSLRKERGP